MVPGEHPDGFCTQVGNGPSWGRRVQRHLARLERRDGTGRVEGGHRFVLFPILYLIIGSDCLPKLTTLITTGT